MARTRIESLIRNANKRKGEPFVWVYFRETYNKVRKGDFEETVIGKQEMSGFGERWKLKSK